MLKSQKFIPFSNRSRREKDKAKVPQHGGGSKTPPERTSQPHTLPGSPEPARNSWEPPASVPPSDNLPPHPSAPDPKGQTPANSAPPSPRMVAPFTHIPASTTPNNNIKNNANVGAKFTPSSPSTLGGGEASTVSSGSSNDTGNSSLSSMSRTMDPSSNAMRAPTATPTTLTIKYTATANDIPQTTVNPMVNAEVAKSNNNNYRKSTLPTGILPPDPVRYSLLKGYTPPSEEIPAASRLPQSQNPPQHQARTLNLLMEEPCPSKSGASSKDRTKFGGVCTEDGDEMLVPTGTRGIPGITGDRLLQPPAPEPVPGVHELIEEKRRKSSAPKNFSSFYKNHEVYELTLYNKKGQPRQQEALFKGQRAHLITPHTLYKEALYTSVHYLGVPTIRFPSTKEDMCLYSHVVFKASPQDQVTAMEHVVGEAFPLTVINTKVRRADMVEARESNGLPSPYCIVAVETEQSSVDFQIDTQNWGRISTGTPLRPKAAKDSKGNRPLPEKRFDQAYDNVPSHIKTTVQAQTRNPAWDQRFQGLALRPSVDILTLEIWDYIGALSKKNDVFIGKVPIPVRDIPCEGEAKWHYVKGTTHRKKEATGRLLLEVWLTHAYRHGKNYEEYAEPRIMLEMFWDHVLQYESARYPGEWTGDIPPAATCLLFQYALQTGISEGSQAIIRWNAYAKYNLGLFALERRLTELESALEKARDWKDVRECELESNMIMLAVEKILPVIRNHLHESQETVHEAVKAIKHCREILQKFQCQSGLFQVQFWIEAEIRMAILEWYQATYTELVVGHTGMKAYDLAECLARVVNAVNALMRDCEKKWQPLFWMDGLIKYLPLAYDEFQKMIIHDVEMVCYHLLSRRYDTNEKLRHFLVNLDSDARHLCRALFDLYVETQVFVSEQERIFEGVQEAYYHLNRYHRWFRPILVLWLGYALIRAADMISYSIKIDNIVVENESVMTSSSATDAGVIYHQLAAFWQQLNWPDVAEGYVILHYLFEVMCFVTILYARLKRAKLEKEGYFDTVDRFDISERFCTALNNIEYVKETLIKIPDEIQMDGILTSLDHAVGIPFARNHRIRVNQLLTGTLSHIETQFKKILYGVAERIRPELREAFRECFLYLQDPRKTEEDALIPVLSYLEDNIVILHKSLLELNFIRTLQMFWSVTCQEMMFALKLFTKEKDVREEGLFFQRIHTVVALLVTYFQGGGGGLNDMEVESKYYRQLKLFLSCLTLPTETLIAAYYREVAEEQLEISEASKLGSLKIRVNYHSSRLLVEVISGHNLSARDEPLPLCSFFRKQEPSSDPQVEMILMPPQNFPDAKSQKTEIQWKTQNPVFNEKFEWQVAEDICSKLDSVIVFTVRDYDMVTRDDFLGEAIIPIAQMPGLMKLRPVAQPMTLQLRSVDLKNNPVLTILSTRKWDGKALAFVKNLRDRVVEIKDEPPLKLSE